MDRLACGGVIGGSTPDAGVRLRSPQIRGPALALTYDGAILRLYVNGTQVSTQAQAGTLVTSTNSLQIGGDSTFGQYFAGTIDEIRIYNVALTAAQIQSYMNTAIGISDTQAPTSPTNRLRHGSERQPDQPELDWRQRTTSASPDIWWNVVRAQVARASRKSPLPQRLPTATRILREYQLQLPRARHRCRRKP